jgi:hypothetical protein
MHYFTCLKSQRCGKPSYCSRTIRITSLFLFFVCNHCCSESFLTQQAIHLYHISCIVVPQWQSTHWWHHFKVKVMLWSNSGVKETLIFFSSFYQINSKLGVKVSYGLQLSWLIFGTDQPWPSRVSLRVENCLLQGQILKLMEPYCAVP